MSDSTFHTVIDSAAAMQATVGQPLGLTEWLPVEQNRIDLFAEATGDHQWIHVDPVRAKDGPFGACIAHGYLTLALVNYFLPQIWDVQNLAMGVNYGCDRVRFPAPLKAGQRVRGRGELVKVEPIGAAMQATVRVTVEIEGNERPACVVDTISQYTF
jgi:acyl dehydratase